MHRVGSRHLRLGQKERQAAPGQGHRHGLRLLRLRGRLSHLPLRHLSRHRGGQAGRGRRDGPGGDRLGRDRPGFGHHHGHDRRRGLRNRSGRCPDHLRRYRFKRRSGGLLLASDPDDRPRHQGGGRSGQGPGPGGPGRRAQPARGGDGRLCRQDRLQGRQTRFLGA